MYNIFNDVIVINMSVKNTSVDVKYTAGMLLSDNHIMFIHCIMTEIKYIFNDEIDF